MPWALIRQQIGEHAGINLAVLFVALITALQTDTAYSVGKPSTVPTTSPLPHGSKAQPLFGC
jgi:hypothetical protein